MILIWQERVIFTREQLAELSLQTQRQSSLSHSHNLLQNLTHKRIHPQSLPLSFSHSHTHTRTAGTRHTGAASGNIMRELEGSANGID